MSTDYGYIGVLYKAVRAALMGHAIWGNRVYADEAPMNATRPYVIFFQMGGGQFGLRRYPDSEIVLHVRCVADSTAQSLEGQAAISGILRDAGLQDGGAVVGSDGWSILTISQLEAINIFETFENAATIHHAGHQFRVHMENV